ncbi:MAG: multiple sugar transport system permease protein, partial [Propionibacteriaceae bacterium]|nr:multiple sugar transport system permease protein [Propionibacteriaceae bacterium]
MSSTTYKPPVTAQVAEKTLHKPKSAGRSPGTVALLMLLPAGVLMITFLIIPIGLTFVLAFTNARLISPEPA